MQALVQQGCREQENSHLEWPDHTVCLLGFCPDSWMTVPLSGVKTGEDPGVEDK